MEEINNPDFDQEPDKVEKNILNKYTDPWYMFNTRLIDPPKEIIKIQKILFPIMGILYEKPLVEKRYRQNLNLILMNLYICYIQNKLLRFSRGKRFHTIKCGKQNRKFFSQKKCNELMDSLTNHQFITKYLGYQSIKYDSKQTRYELLDSLNTLFRKINKYLIFDIERLDINIILKTNSKNKYKKMELDNINNIKFRIMGTTINTIMTNKYLYEKSIISVNIPFKYLVNKSNKKVINNLINNIAYNSIIKILNNHNEYQDLITIYINIIYNNLYTYTTYTDKTYPVNFCTYKYLKSLQEFVTLEGLNILIESKYIYRVFKNNFLTCGRFYGPVYQRFNKDIRKFIKIDNEETIELDYGEMYLRMLYHTLGHDPKYDLYIYKDLEIRKRIKIICQIMLNCNSKEKTIRAILYNIQDPKGLDLKEEDVKKILNKLEYYHSPIKEYFYTMVGLKLQYAESEIMYNILNELRKKNIIGLPIHDSIIIKKKHKWETIKLMKQIYFNMFGFEPIIK